MRRFGAACGPEAHPDGGHDSGEAEGQNPGVDVHYCCRIPPVFSCFVSPSTSLTSASSSAMERLMKIQAMAQTSGKKSTPSTNQVKVNPKIRLAINSGKK